LSIFSLEALYQPKVEKPNVSHVIVMTLDVQVFYTPSLKGCDLSNHVGNRGENSSAMIFNGGSGFSSSNCY